MKVNDFALLNVIKMLTRLYSPLFLSFGTYLLHAGSTYFELTMEISDYQEKVIGLQSVLYNLALNLTTNHDDACDLVQDTTLRALKNESKYSEDVNFKGWLCTIMRHLFYNDYRRHARLGIKIESCDGISELRLSDHSSVSTPEGSIMEHDVRTVLNSFSSENRLPLSLFLAGYKYVEISEMLGLPLSTVKNRIYIMRRRLQERLIEYAV